jgi:uncharacterized membrane protein YkoI
VTPMTSQRFAKMTARAGFKEAVAAGVAAAALVCVADSAAARPRPWALSLLQAEQQAEPLGPAQDQLFPSQRGGGVSLAQATAMAQSAFQGRVVSARTVQMGDRMVHEIRILGEDGRTVRTFRIDAQTGAFL